MIKYSSDICFSVNQYPKDYFPDFNTYLFNIPEHLQFQSNSPIVSFYIYNEKKGTLLARIHFFVKDIGLAVSPYRSPFGSIEFKEQLDLKILIAFIKYFLEMLKNLHVRSVQIKSFPFAYDEKNSVKLCHALLECGFTINHSEINHHLKKPGFEKNLHKMEIRKLKKSEQAGLHFSSEPISNLPAVYAFIKECRNERNQNLSMELQELAAIANVFPENYLIFTAKQQEKIIACTIVVKVNDKVWYNFYPASSIEFNSKSPLIFLYKNIIQHLPEEVEIFDLGTSYLQDQPNFGLINFKERLGGIVSLKFSFYKELINHS